MGAANSDVTCATGGRKEFGKNPPATRGLRGRVGHGLMWVWARDDCRYLGFGKTGEFRAGGHIPEVFHLGEGCMTGKLKEE